MDILPSHKGSRVRQLLEVRGRELLCLSPYSSPDLNPIEAFSKVKRRLRRSPTVRARQASVEAMGAPLDAIAAQEDVSAASLRRGYRTYRINCYVRPSRPLSRPNR